MADVDWGGANLTSISWHQVSTIGEEGPLRLADVRKAELDKTKKRLDEVEVELKVLRPVETFERSKRDYMEGDPPQVKTGLTAAETDEMLAALDVVTRGQPLVEESLRLSKLVSDQSLMLPSDRLHAQVDSARAYSQLANALRAQGLLGDSARFAYRSLRLRRVVPRRERQLLRVREAPSTRRIVRWFQWVVEGAAALRDVIVSEGKVFASFLVDLVCGYGYRPGRALLAYAAVVVAFAGGYAAAGLTFWPTAVVFSVTSFHGRGFAELLNTLSSGAHNRAVEIAAVEAFAGLLMEVVLVATFTRRLFDR